MAADVVLIDEARQEIKDLKNVAIATRLFKLVDRLKNWPNVSGVKALSGNLAGKYRIRTGDYRLQFRVEARPGATKENGTEITKEIPRFRIIIEKAGHRDGFYDE